MVKADARPIWWRIFAVVAAAAWMLMFLAQIVRANLAIAIIGAILPAAVITFTLLFAFGYNFRNEKAQRRVCVIGIMLCGKRLLPIIGAATFFFQASVARNHWNTVQAMGARAGLIAVAVVIGIEIWALAVFSKPPVDNDGLGEIFS